MSTNWPGWPEVKRILADGTVSELRQALATLNTPSVTSIYQSLEELWRNPNANYESIDIFLDFLGTYDKFSLICYGIMSRYARMVDEDKIWAAAALQQPPQEVQEQLGNDQPLKLTPEILAERILRRDSSVMNEKRSHENDEGMNLLHYAVRYNAKGLISTIINLYKSNEIGSPERLLITSGRRCDSPLKMVIKEEKLDLLHTILEALPTLRIEDTILSDAISLKRNDMLVAFVKLRSDCVTIELVQYCISSKQTSILDEILSRRSCILHGHRLLYHAIREGDEAIIKKLLDACPDLAIEEDAREISPLHFLQQEGVKGNLDVSARQSIRSLVLPSVIRRTNTLPQANGAVRIHPIDQIRKLLADTEYKRKEVSLDLGGFRHSDKSIEPFLKMIKGLSSTSNSTKQKAASLLTVDFENTLRYVDIPIPAFPRSDVDYQSIPERLEAFIVLQWLHDSKDVSGIYELRVRDSLYLPHTEEVIAQCLKQFNIELLDWMRVDMSIKPFVETCPLLKKLTLYVSNWANLSYWVSGDGYEQLNGFPELKEVEIFILTDLIGASYSSKYEQESRSCQKESRAKLAGQTPPTEVKFNMNFYLRSWSSLTMRHENPPTVKKSTSVEVTQLGAFIEAYSLLQSEFQDSEFLNENNAQAVLSPIINVAVIDTGVDPDSIKCFEIAGASFVSSESGESPWWFSYHPHGTQMAKVITELNPFCRLLVAKVGDSVMDMTVDRVIQALKWAIASRADIISISAAFFTDRNQFRMAIQEVIAENIVVVASTAGQGHRQEEAYPANYPEVLKIAATDYRGRETVESVRETAHFMFPGENIVAKTTFLGSSNPTDEISGTSVATAIASGVASLVLACHRLSLSKRHNERAWQEHKELKRTLVNNVFTKMVDNSGKFVKPWLFFRESADQGESEEQSESENQSESEDQIESEDQSSWGEARSTLDWLSRKNFPLPKKK